VTVPGGGGRRRRLESEEGATVAVARHGEPACNGVAELLDGGVDAVGDAQRTVRAIVAQLAFLGRPEGDVPQVDLIALPG
jgi:hypothetical protein